MKYPIESEQISDMPRSGGVFLNATSEVELTDEEVARLVQLMREKNTSDVEALELETNEPDIYDKLYEACAEICCDAAFNEAWLDAYWEAWSGNDGGDTVAYDMDEMMNYCECRCGFTYEGNEADEDYEEKKAEAFEKWLDHYLHTAPKADVLTFFKDNMELLIYDCEFVDPTVIDYDVTVVIPQPIIDMAFPK